MIDLKAELAAAAKRFSVGLGGSAAATGLSAADQASRQAHELVPEVFLGLTAGEWAIAVSVLTAVFMVAQTAYLMWRWRRDMRRAELEP